MRVAALALTNIKGQVGTRVFDPLPEGVLLLLGRNGRGKTSVPEAISVGVFGNRPHAFRGRGTSMPGFVNSQCDEARIRAVVQFSDDQTYTYDVVLTETTNPSGTVSTSVSAHIYEGAQALTGDLAVVEALHQNLSRDGISVFTQEILSLPLKADDLCHTLLSPPQTGGLTAFFEMAPKDRATRTETMLGLQRVREVGQALSRRLRDLRARSNELADQMHDRLAARAAAIPPLAAIRVQHGRGRQKYGALGVAELRASFNGVRGERVRDAGERVVDVHRAREEQAKARGVLDKVNILLQKLQAVVQAVTTLGQAEAALVESVQAEADARALEPPAKRWKAASDAVDVLVAQKEARDAKRAEIHQALATANATISGHEGRASQRGEELDGIKNLRTELHAAIEDLAKAVPDWEARYEAATDAKQVGADQLVDIRVLRELYAAASGLGEMAEAGDRLAQVREALNAQRLPGSAGALIDVIARSLEEVERMEGAEGPGGWSTQLGQWQTEAQAASDAATEAWSILGTERDQANAARQQAQAQIEAGLQRQLQLETAEVADAAQVETADAERKQLAKALKDLEAEHTGLDTALQTQREIKEDAALAGAYTQWLGKTALAAQKAARQAARDQREAAAEVAAEATGIAADQRPKLDDHEKWEDLRDGAHARGEAAQQALADANTTVVQTVQDHQVAMTALRALQPIEEELVTLLAALHEKRVVLRELTAFSDQVVQRIPGAVARRVVDQVSDKANTYFHQLFLQPSQPTDIRWDPSDYVVYVDRPTGTIQAKQASGGERMAMGISLNLAILHFMAPGVRWLVLDEPTAGLDKINRSGLSDFVDLLRQPTADGRGLFDQLLFISHESDLFEGLGGAYIFDDDGVRLE